MDLYLSAATNTSNKTEINNPPTQNKYMLVLHISSQSESRINYQLFSTISMVQVSLNGILMAQKFTYLI